MSVFLKRIWESKWDIFRAKGFGNSALRFMLLSFTTVLSFVAPRVKLFFSLKSRFCYALGSKLKVQSCGLFQDFCLSSRAGVQNSSVLMLFSPWNCTERAQLETGSGINWLEQARDRGTKRHIWTSFGQANCFYEACKIFFRDANFFLLPFPSWFQKVSLSLHSSSPKALQSCAFISLTWRALTPLCFSSLQGGWEELKGGGSRWRGPSQTFEGSKLTFWYEHFSLCQEHNTHYLILSP